MTYLESILLGALQGIAEFLPISSSGHLVLAERLFGLKEIPLLYDVLLHVSTLVVVIVVFRNRIGAILRSLWKGLRGAPDAQDRIHYRLILVILLASVFTAGLGLLIAEWEIRENPKLVSALLIATGGILAGTRFFKKGQGYSHIGWKAGVITGLAQGLGVFPGISRSGITISASLVSGMDRETAGEYSFLLSIPAILGALVLELKDAEALLDRIGAGVLAVGILASFVVGLVALLLLLKVVKRGKMYLFGLYLLPMGILGLIFF